jgi:hypothetical protein
MAIRRKSSRTSSTFRGGVSPTKRRCFESMRAITSLIQGVAIDVPLKAA